MVFSNPCGTLCIKLGVTACGKLLTFLWEENRAPGLSNGSSERHGSSERRQEITRSGEAGLRVRHVPRHGDPLLESVTVFRVGLSSDPSFFQLQVALGHSTVKGGKHVALPRRHRNLRFILWYLHGSRGAGL